MPSDSQESPGLNCSGSTPMPTRFERVMRSKLLQTTALMPSSWVPLAAQSRLEPVAVLLAPKTMVGVPSAMYFIAAS